MKTYALMMVASGLLFAAEALGDDQVGTEREKLQGTWTAITVERHGKTVPEDVAKKVRVVIAGDKITVKDESQGKEERFTYKLSTTEKPPRAIDLFAIDQKKPETYFQGIYSLEGKTLKLCWNRGHEERPTAFVSQPKSDTVLIVLEKDSEKAADRRDAYEGTIVSVQGDKILVREPKAKLKFEQAFTVSRGARISIDGKDREIGDLHAGLKVRITAKQGVATRIEATTEAVGKDANKK